jgi:TPR repeat protein
MTRYGDFLFSGSFVDKNKSAAVDKYQEAADLDYAPAKLRCALCYFGGHGFVTKGKQKAFSLFREVFPVAHNSILKQFFGVRVSKSFSEFFLKISLQIRDDSISSTLLQMSESVFFPESFLKISEFYFEKEKNYEKALFYFTLALTFKTREASDYCTKCILKSSDHNFRKNNFSQLKKFSASSQKMKLELGKCYLFGRGTKKDYKSAFHIFESLFKQKYPESHLYYGVCLLFGYGTKINNDGINLIQKNALETDPDNYYYGYCTFYGIEKDINIEEGFSVFCDLKNHPDALIQIGICYHRGIVVEQSNVKAFQSFLAAAKQNSADALCYLGLCHINGIGTTYNAELGQKLIAQSKTMGSDLGTAFYYYFFLQTNVATDFQDKAFRYFQENHKKNLTAG